MKIYLRLLSICYFLGAFLHLLDIFDLRLNFSEMSLPWKIWIVSLMIADTIASIGLWKQKSWGIYTFMTIAVAQLIAYAGFLDSIPNQIFLVIFHTATLGIYFMLLRIQKSSLTLRQ